MELNKPKVLMFTEWYEPGFKAGGPIQSCRNIVMMLSDKFSFYVYTSDRDIGDQGPYLNIETDKWIPLNNGSFVRYTSTEVISFSSLKNMIAQVNPDVIYFNSMYSPGFTLKPLIALKQLKFKKRIILAPRGMLHPGAVSSKRIKKNIFLFITSRLGLMKNIIFHATDKDEKIFVEKYYKINAGVIIASNIPSIETGMWQPRKKETGEISCVFISRIHPHKNLSFILKALQNINNDCRIKLDIYGVIDDKNYYIECLQLAKGLKDNIHVTFNNPLPHEEIFSVLMNTHLFILPTLGENFGHAIFEALSSGCPVLISNKTPWNDIAHNSAGWVFPLLNIDQYTDVVEDVCKMDSETFNSVSLNARKYADQYIKSMNIIDTYSRLFE